MHLVIAAVFVGAVLQRVSGIGFAVVVAPFVVLALGPAQGVVTAQLCGAATAALVLARVLPDVDWVAYRRLLPASVVGIVVGSLVVARLSTATAQVVTGGVLVLGLLAAPVAAARWQVSRGPLVTACAGGAAGTMTALAGAGGVALTVLGGLTRWEQRPFAATLQPYFFTVSAVTVVARVATTPSAWPGLGAAGWTAVAVAVGAGLAVGDVAARRLPAVVAARTMTALAWAGALLTLADGLSRG